MKSPKEFLDEAEERAPREPLRLTIRELLAHWGAKRRGYWVVDQIKRDLHDHGLMTHPPFEEEWIDNIVALVLRDAPAERERIANAEGTTSASVAQVPDVSLKVASLQSASGSVSSVQREDSLVLAKSLMMRHDYSQLAVMSGRRELLGAVSWESIGRASVTRTEPTVVDALVRATLVEIEDDLITQIPRVVDEGFVFVRSADRQICGIVTTADLSAQLRTLASPFFLVGEIERRLRRAVSERFTPEELAEVRYPSEHTRPIESADDLALGELQRLLEKPASWERMEWAIDRTQFVQAMDGVRELRNDIMHFSPDPLEDDELAALRNFIKWLRALDPSR